MNDSIKSELMSLYERFMREVDIDPQTGILGRITNSRNADQIGSIRFSGFPFIGSKYSESSPKILIVGLDIGVDEKYSENTFHSFKSRNDCIEPYQQTDNEYNIHISGTYGVILYLLKERYGWNEYWRHYFANKHETFKSIVDSFGKSHLPFDVMCHVAFTNIFKFVTVGRNGRSGNENRKWYNPTAEKQLFINEVDIFSPDIIYIQGQSSFDKELLNHLKETGYHLVLSDHPSSWRNGANRPTYVDKLKYINW